LCTSLLLPPTGAAHLPDISRRQVDAVSKTTAKTGREPANVKAGHDRRIRMDQLYF
jgi:hypothetical protein